MAIGCEKLAVVPPGYHVEDARQRLSGSAAQRLSGSAARRLGGSAAMPMHISRMRHAAVSPFCLAFRQGQPHSVSLAALGEQVVDSQRLQSLRLLSYINLQSR